MTLKDDTVFDKEVRYLNPYPKQALQYKTYKKLGKGEIASNQQFLLFP